jgi:hypothetical protein
VEYRGGTYFFAGKFDRGIAFGPFLGGGQTSVCSDVMLPGSAAPLPQKVPAEVHKVRGVRPAVAIGGPGPRTTRLYLRRGFLLTVPEHPLHDNAFGRSNLPDLRTGRRCGRRMTLNGLVVNVQPAGVTLQVTGASPRGARQVGRTVFLNTDAATVVRRLPRWAGLPFIRPGLQLGARARSCDRQLARDLVVRGLVAESLFDATPPPRPPPAPSVPV